MILRSYFLMCLCGILPAATETSDRVLTQMVYKFLFTNELICGDPFESSEWLPAVNECDIGCDETRYLCVMHTDTKEQICRPLPIECESALRAHLGWSQRTVPLTTTTTTERPTTMETRKTQAPTTTFPPPVMLSFRPPSHNFVATHSVDQNALSQTEQFQRDLLGLENTNSVNQQNTELIEIGSFRIANEAEQNGGYSFDNQDSNDIQEQAVRIDPTTTQRSVNIATYPINRPGPSAPLPRTSYSREDYSTMNGASPPATEPRPPAINRPRTQEYVTASTLQNYLNGEDYAPPPPPYDGDGPIPPAMQVSPIEDISLMLGQRVDLVPPPPPANPVDMDPNDEYILSNQIKHFDDPQQLKRMLSQSMNGGAIDLSRRCCEWALQGLCDRSWQKVRKHCSKSCGTLICEKVDGVKSCNRVLNVDIEDCFETMRLVRYFGLRTASSKREKDAVIEGVHHKLSSRKRKGKKKRMSRV